MYVRVQRTTNTRRRGSVAVAAVRRRLAFRATDPWPVGRNSTMLSADQARPRRSADERRVPPAGPLEPIEAIAQPITRHNGRQHWPSRRPDDLFAGRPCAHRARRVSSSSPFARIDKQRFVPRGLRRRLGQPVGLLPERGLPWRCCDNGSRCSQVISAVPGSVQTSQYSSVSRLTYVVTSSRRWRS